MYLDSVTQFHKYNLQGNAKINFNEHIETL
jgi:hypothetical protein